MTPRLPPHAPGMVIGLYGGSFNPVHAGHLHVSKVALKRLGLDRLWWLVTPGNPLKAKNGLAPLSERITAARKLVRDPRIIVTGLEADLGSPYSADTLTTLSARAPGVRFVWVMGADSLAGFHRWRRWQEIIARVPVAVVNRPGWRLPALASPAARAAARWRLREELGPRLAHAPAPAWLLLHGPTSPLSSTALRAAKAKTAKSG